MAGANSILHSHGLARMRKARALPTVTRSGYYVRRAANQVGVFVCFFVFLYGVEHVMVSGQEYNVTESAQVNKRMNFPMVMTNRTVDIFGRSISDYETGDTLDDTNAGFNERRWTFKNGVDMVLRLDKGLTFCSSYVTVPAESAWPAGLRGFIYMLCLFYLFLGVAIISDLFMAGIEHITAEKEKVVVMKEKGKEKEKVIMYTIWNETVANLTLLALGSSAPEILLSVVETVSNLDKVPGELGPSTIVGSAAFNLLMITAICMWSLKEVKKIKEFGVFVITALASIFAYVWMIIVLLINTPDVVDVWEAFATLAFFPLLVLFAFLQDRNYFMKSKDDDDGSVADEEEGQPQERRRSKVLDAKFVGCNEDEVLNIISSAKNKKGGSLTEDDIKEELDKLRPHKKLNSGHYRMNAIRGAISKGSGSHKHLSSERFGNKVAPTPMERSRGDMPDTGVVEFVSPSYSVLEGEGVVWLKVRRHHASKGKLSLRYSTADLTAVDGVHYHRKEGVLVFEDNECADKDIKIAIIDNDVRNADMLFTCKLEPAADTMPNAVGDVNMALITIIDDDLPGDIRFRDNFMNVPESCGSAKIEVMRENGCTGSLLVKYRTEDGTAKSQGDYISQQGHINFSPGETQKVIEIPIIDRSQYAREDFFFVHLTSVEGKAGGRLGTLTTTRIVIEADRKVVSLVKDVMNQANDDGVPAHVSWGGQFREAMNIGGEETPSNLAYTMHFFTFFWKILFALVPPPHIGGGWACFCISLFFIGLVTAMVAEIAGLLGCVMGLKDSVTAITFVALGTSLPDTFASKQAAENEEYADAAVGNVTGSNSVNVFLGLGMPWVIASLYYTSKGECFIVPSGSIGFSVFVFTVTATICLLTLVVLRFKQGGEIGGPMRKPIAIFMGSLWLAYITISSLQVYGHIPNFPGTEKRCPCDCKNRGILPWSDLPAFVTGSCNACANLIF